MPISFLRRMKQENISKSIQIQDGISALLKVTQNPPGTFDQLFGKISGEGDEMEWAKARLNKLTHGDGE